MGKNFLDIVQIARQRVRQFPNLSSEDVLQATKRYTKGLIDEVKEVEEEVRENNEVYLIDELSDIAWDYAMLLSLLEMRGLITNIEDVLEHGYTKYTQRVASLSQEQWEEIKQLQKQQLDAQHRNKYE